MFPLSLKKCIKKKRQLGFYGNHKIGNDFLWLAVKLAPLAGGALSLLPNRSSACMMFSGSWFWSINSGVGGAVRSCDPMLFASSGAFSIQSREAYSPALSTCVRTVEETKVFLEEEHVTAIIASWKLSLVAPCSEGATPPVASLSRIILLNGNAPQALLFLRLLNEIFKRVPVNWLAIFILV